jgi:hypothetical protein
MAAALLFCLPLSAAWNALRRNLEGRNPEFFYAIQPLEDVVLTGLFILGLAALLSSTFAPNLYAKF